MVDFFIQSGIKCLECLTRFGVYLRNTFSLFNLDDDIDLNEDAELDEHKHA